MATRSMGATGKNIGVIIVTARFSVQLIVRCETNIARENFIYSLLHQTTPRGREGELGFNYQITYQNNARMLEYWNVM